MSRKPGEPTNAKEIAQLSEVDISDIAQSLKDLGTTLVTSTTYLADRPGRPDYLTLSGEPYYQTIKAQRQWAAETEHALEQLLQDLATFRKAYSDWERVAAEYALEVQGMSQRRVADLLDVSTSTINRWSRNPVTFTWNDSPPEGYDSSSSEGFTGGGISD